VKVFPESLLWRTLIVMVAALVLSQLAAVYLLHQHVTQPRTRLAIGQFVSHLKTISAALQTMDDAQEAQFVARIAERDGIRIQLSRNTERMRPAAKVLRGAASFATTSVRCSGRRPRCTCAPPTTAPPKFLWVRLPSGDKEFWVAFPRGRIDRDPATAFIAWAAVGVLIAILATFFILWRLTRPLQELARAAEDLGKGKDPAPVAESGPSEVRAVTHAFNQMKEDLRRSERDRATFLAGISHDLRTPLSRLRLDIEMLEGKVEGDVQRGMISDLGDMNAIIDQFIDFTRAESAEPLVPVDLSQVARLSAERSTRAGVQVKCELADTPTLMLRPLAMQRLVDNLLGNAAKHAAGEALLRTATSPGAVTLAVLDRGPGIPSDLAERLKEPFTRRDESRAGSSGAGLGLAIANRIAALHGGRLELLPREGGGLEARVTLPTAT
jgi:two-component system osmolarity sensor histidine kinase EnvZ